MRKDVNQYYLGRSTDGIGRFATGNVCADLPGAHEPVAIDAVDFFLGSHFDEPRPVFRRDTSLHFPVAHGHRLPVFTRQDGNLFVAPQRVDEAAMINDRFHTVRVPCARNASNRISVVELAYAKPMDREELLSPGARLRWAREKAGFKTAKEAAKRLHIGDVSYRAYENDQHGFVKHAWKFGKLFNVDPEWLVEGVNHPVANNPDTPASSVSVIHPPSSNLTMLKRMDIYNVGIRGAEVLDLTEDCDFVPFSNGFLHGLSKAPVESLFIVSNLGDAMEPTIRRDDWAMVDKSIRDLRVHDQIWVLSYAGAGMVKRLRPAPGGKVQILSDNPAVPTIEADSADVDILGRVIWVARMM